MWNELALKCAKKYSGSWARTYEALEIKQYRFAYWFARGGRIYVDWPLNWELLEKDARESGRQFCLIDKFRRQQELKLYRREFEYREIRSTINRFKQEIRNHGKELAELR